LVFDQPHEIQAGNPAPQRQVMAGANGVGDLVEALTAVPSFVTWTKRLGASSRPFSMSESDEYEEHATPWGYRMSRMVLKQLMSS
jgi:hypothetical protein